MAIRFVTACAIVARLTQLTDACDAGGMATCQTMLTGDGSLCSRYAAYTKCFDNLLASCSASARAQFSVFMEATTSQYGSQLKDCSSSEPSSENEKSSGSGSNSGSSNQDNSKACTSGELHKKSPSCIQKMIAAAAGGNTCGAWQTYECCLKDAFASCGSDMQSEISTMMSSMQTQYGPSLPGLSKCGSSTCSSGSQSTPAEVETTLMAHIHMSDPLAFNLTMYVEAVKKATGVAQLPEAVLKAFEIVVKYILPDATEIAVAKAAIAKANGVEDSQVEITQSGARRLGAGRRLATNVDVTITVPDKEKAAAVQTSAANTTTLESQLGGSVSVAKAPVATAKVETKVKTAPLASSQLVSQIENAGSDVGGTIKAEVKTAAPDTLESNGASSNFSMLLFTVVLLLRIAF